MKYFACLLGLLCLLSAPALAKVAAVAPPTKESLISAWEESLKSNPHTKLLEKKSDGVYTYETDLLPYKGELKILNAFIDDRDPYSYGYYDEDGAGRAWHGIVEAELSGLGEGCGGKDKYQLGYAAWSRGNRLFYAASEGTWYTQDQWSDRRRAAAEKEAAPHCTPSSASVLKPYIDALLPLLVFLLVLLVAVRAAKKQQKRVSGLQETIMERQLAALKMSEEGLALQREQIRLLQELLKK